MDQVRRLALLWLGVAACLEHGLEHEHGRGAALSVRSLSVLGDGAESRIVLGDGSGSYMLAADAAGALTVRSGARTVVSVDANGTMGVDNLHARGRLRVDGQLEYHGVSQWFLARVDDFETSCTAWSNCTRTTCAAAGDGGAKMLGGYGAFAGGEVSKLYVRLDSPHTQLRLKATFHFIDRRAARPACRASRPSASSRLPRAREREWSGRRRWEGESAYAKLDNQFVWSEAHSVGPKAPGVNLCGGEVPETKFAVPIDVVRPRPRGCPFLSSTAAPAIPLTSRPRSAGDPTRIERMHSALRFDARRARDRALVGSLGRADPAALTRELERRSPRERSLGASDSSVQHFARRRTPRENTRP